MTKNTTSTDATPPRVPNRPIRTAVFRGAGVILPPLFTIVILVWLAMMTNQYLFAPVTSAIRSVILYSIADIRSENDPEFENDVAARQPRGEKARLSDEKVYLRTPEGNYIPLTIHKSISDAPQQRQTPDGLTYQRTHDEKYIPMYVYETARDSPGELSIKTAKAKDIYRRYIEVRYLPYYFTVPCLAIILFLLLYLLGKFIAAGLGRFVWHTFERLVHRLPLIRTVYSSVKQITDFLFTERDIEFARCVVVEYPRKGIYSLGFVTGESLVDIRSAANEPVLSVLMPTSPMPMTGFTVTVLQSETIDLNITIDQALQFIVSCGVVVPPAQLTALARDREAINRPNGTSDEDAVVPAASSPGGNVPALADQSTGNTASADQPAPGSDAAEGGSSGDPRKGRK